MKAMQEEQFKMLEMVVEHKNQQHLKNHMAGGGGGMENYGSAGGGSMEMYGSAGGYNMSQWQQAQQQQAQYNQ